MKASPVRSTASCPSAADADICKDTRRYAHTDTPSASASDVLSNVITADRADGGTAFHAKSISGDECRRWLSCLSHEIRNSLTLVYSSLQILEKEYPDISESSLWEQTKDDIRYLIRLLKDSSTALRDYQPNFTVFSVQEFFQELSFSAGSLLNERHIQLDRHVFPDVSAYISASHELLIKADRPRLKEALMNLLINAADALSSAPDSHDRHILLYADLPGANDPTLSFPETDHSSLRSPDAGCHPCPGFSGSSGCRSSAGRAVRLHVRDNGPGIPDEYLDTLFDPFVTHKSNGTGLGLSIVKNIAALHGGTVSVETNPSAEASFTDFCLCIPTEFSY